jgi:26S proteasome regulatory subunit N10
MSMEEEAARQAAASAPVPSSSDATAAPTAAGAVTSAPDGSVAVQQPSGPTVAVSAVASATDEGDEALLQQALALSEGHAGAPDVEMTEDQDGEDENLTEEEMIARAIEMSMHPEPESEEKKK